MEFWKKQKRVLTAFGIFLALMFLCTLISRAVYASRLPQVSVETPRRMALNHTVAADGIAHQGREYAVTALSGLRVRTVYANVGDKVTTETLLFDLDLEDLKEKIQNKELEIKKLQLQIASLEQNKSLDAQKQQTENARAQEDYNRAESKTGEALERAREDLEDAEDAYDAHRDHPEQVTSEEERRAQMAAYEEWSRKKTELEANMEEAERIYQEALKGVVEPEEASKTGEPGTDIEGESEGQGASEPGEAEKNAEDAKEKWETARAAYEEYMKNPMEKPDYSAEDAAKAAWEEKKDTLNDTVEDAKRALEDAERSRSDTLLEAGRKVEDAVQTPDTDSSLMVSRLELSVLQTELAAYKRVQDTSGQVYPEAEGVITRIQVSPGERVGDGAAVVYADLSSPMQFQVSLTKEQKKYVNQGDTAELSLGGSSPEEVEVDYIAENEMNPELYDARIFLSDGMGTIGQSGNFRVETQSETFSCCIPLNALHVDANQRSFVYIVSERSGILGTELVAEQIYVKVLDQNDSYAAIEEGVIDRDTELITDSTEELEDRTVVRYKE